MKIARSKGKNLQGNWFWQSQKTITPERLEALRKTDSFIPENLLFVPPRLGSSHFGKFKQVENLDITE